MPSISSKNQVTLPVRALRDAGLRAGDDVTVMVDGPDRIVVSRAADPARALGIFDGIYGPGYLDELRAGDWD